jgi:hypothetical protein
MLNCIVPLTSLLGIHDVPCDVVSTDNPGEIIYEDEWQVGVL